GKPEERARDAGSESRPTGRSRGPECPAALRTAPPEQGRKRGGRRHPRRLWRLPHETADASDRFLPGPPGHCLLPELRTDSLLHPRDESGGGGVATWYV